MAILPVFDGKYEVENISILSRCEWLSFTGSMHRQMKDVPDGGWVKIVAGPEPPIS
jgi:hypothetical protein